MSTLAQLFDLTGRVAIVTGGSRGLGYQIARALGEYGAQIALIARKREQLDEAIDSLGALGIVAQGFAANLQSHAAAQAVVDEVFGAFGKIDILVNNAGTTWGAPAESHPLDGWNKVLDVNVTGLFLITQATAVRAFLPRQQGVVLNVASTEGLLGHLPDRVGTVAYNASKGAVISLTRSLAAEWGPRNIRVNALAPGFFPSKMTAVTLGQHSEMLLAGTPLKRLGGETDLMGPALLMVSDAGRHITGQVLVVDGGHSII
jgi:gluconate 5-dehydrogenase